MRIKTDLTGLGVLALAQHSFASSIFQPSQATTTTVQQLPTEEQATYPTPIPVPVPINSEFNENWSPSSDQTDPEAGYTTLAVMVTIYPSKSSARESTTSSTSTSANIASTDVSKSGGLRPDAPVSRWIVLFTALGGFFFAQ